MNPELCELKMDKGFLYVVMPDGREIPFQRSVKVIQESSKEEGFAYVTLELVVKIP